MRNKIKLILSYVLICLSPLGVVFAILIAFLSEKYFPNMSDIGRLLVLLIMISVIIAGVALIFVAVKLMSKIPIVTKNESLPLNFDSYEELKMFLDKALAKKGYRKHVETSLSFGTKLSVYMVEATNREVYCFALCYSSQITQKEFDLSREIIGNSLSDYRIAMELWGKSFINTFHYILMYCVEQENDCFNEIKQMPILPCFQGRYVKKCGTMYVGASFLDKKIYIPEICKREMVVGPYNKMLHKLYRKELCEILNLQESLNPEIKQEK